MDTKACCFTGHRNLPESSISILRKRLQFCIENYIRDGGRYFACGGAFGFDLLAAEEVLKAKQKYPQVQMILLLPYPGYTKYWKQEDQRIPTTKGSISNGTENWLREAIPASVT